MKLEQETYFNFEHFKKGKEEGLSFFYQLYSKPLTHFGSRIIDNVFVIEEILNDAFLATWDLRHMIESPKHLYCFIRLRLKWGCFEYYRKQKREGFVIYDNLDEHFIDESYKGPYFDDNKELLNLIYKAIPLLPPTKATIVDLYFRYGLSCKEIARYYNGSSQHISKQLRSSIDFLKSLIKKKKQVNAFVIVSTKKIAGLSQDVSSEVLEAEQLALFKLRYEEKYSFDRIACQLGMNVSEVQRRYVEAHRKLSSMKNKKQYSYG